MSTMLNHILPVAKKELAYFFHSPAAYVSAGLFVVVVNWLFFANFFLIGQATMRYFFQNVPLVYLFLAPALTMASFAEEKRAKTREILFTLPLTKLEIVLGKFAGAFLLLALSLFLTGGVPLTLSSLGNPEWGPILTGYLASLLLGALFIAIGLLISTLSDNQIMSFVITVAVCFALYIVGTSFFLDRLPAVLAPVLRFISSTVHFENMAKGIIDLRDIVYFASGMGVCVYLTVRKLEQS